MTSATLLVVLALFLGSSVQAVSGMGLGLVSGGILAAALGRQTAVPLLALLSLPSMLAVLWRNRHHVLLGRAAVLLVPGVLLTPAWALVFDRLDATVVARVAGAAILASTVLLATGLRVGHLAGTTGTLAAGALSAAMNIAAGVGSPPVSLYAVNAGWSAEEIRGTLQVYFLGISAAAVVTLGLPSWQPIVVVPAVTAMAVGTVVGSLLAPRLSQRLARAVTLALAAVGGLMLLAG